MKKILWNDGWKFWKEENAFSLVWSVPENAREVTLPHDAMLEEPAEPESKNGGNTGFRNGGVYVYVKNLCPREEASRRKSLIFPAERRERTQSYQL